MFFNWHWWIFSSSVWLYRNLNSRSKNSFLTLYNYFMSIQTDSLVTLFVSEKAGVVLLCCRIMIEFEFITNITEHSTKMIMMWIVKYWWEILSFNKWVHDFWKFIDFLMLMMINSEINDDHIIQIMNKKWNWFAVIITKETNVFFL